MEDESKTKQQLINELKELRLQVNENKILDYSLDNVNDCFINFFEKIPVGYQSLDYNGNLIYVNDAWLKILGYKRNDVINKYFGDFLAPEFLETFKNRFNFLKYKGNVHSEFEMVNSKGVRKSVALYGCIKKNEDGTSDRTHCILHDVSEQKKFENKILEYQTIIEQSVEGIAIADLDGYIYFANEAWAKMHGYLIEEFIGKHLSIFHTKYQFENEVKFFNEKVMSNGSFKGEVWHMRKDGSIFPTLMIMSLMKKDDNKPFRLLVFAIDISEQEKSKVISIEAEKRYRLLFEDANDAIFILNNYIFIECNKKTLNMFGCKSEDEIIGHSPWEFSPNIQPDGGNSKDKFIKSINSTLEGNPQSFYWKHIRKDKTNFDTEISLNVIHFEEKHYIQAIVRDITERKKMEEELLKNRKLESLGILAGGISHDFNNLLLAIQGYIEIARDEINNESHIHNYLISALEATKQAGEITKRLITFSKGGAPLKVSCNISNIIKNILYEERLLKPFKQKIIISDNLWEVFVDEGQIIQVLKNIILNAFESMFEEGLITVKAENIFVNRKDNLPLSDGPYVKISIKDTGVGIDNEKIHLIFDPYYSNKKRGDERGLGLGLSICHSIINKHNGCIKVESELGKGSTFHIYIPAVFHQGFKQESICNPEITDVKKRILVMDDEIVIRDLVSKLLKSMDYLVDTAKDGEEVIKLYSNSISSGYIYDILILDLTVKSGLGGVETMKRLIEINPEVKAIVFSGYSDDIVLENYSQYGFIAALAKPFDKKTLKNTLENIFNAKK